VPPQQPKEDFHDISISKSHKEKDSEEDDEYKDLPRHERELLRFLKEQLQKPEKAVSETKVDTFLLSPVEKMPESAVNAILTESKQAAPAEPVPEKE
jgi:hypothetical protein